MTSPVDAVLERTARDRPAAILRFEAFLRLPSIGTDPAHREATRAAAAWSRDQLEEIGFAADLRETPGQPMVVGHHPGTGAGPHVLYYGHYDVQPPDPLPLWRSPPFEPTVVQGARGLQMVARGAVDDKGQVMTWLEALRAWHAVRDGPPVPVTVLLEGEEESGSPSLEAFLEANRDELGRAALCIVSDTLMWDHDTPAISTRLRGLVYVEITLRGPAHDLHSGLYGGVAPNPLTTLARILGELHDDAGRVQIPGFYDRVRAPEPEERAAWAALRFDEAAFLAGAGLAASHGEAGYSTLERLWARPCCDVNGLIGGYTGEGAKTVIPALARAKLSCRLVPDQDPKEVLASLDRFVRERTPRGMHVELQEMGLARAFTIPTDSSHVDAARRALAATFGRPAALIGMGGSIPAVEAIKRILGLDSLLIGFGLEDDRVHSPNEKFELACFERGIEAHARLLAELANG